ncbi:MAG: hypothetical protein Kow0067_12090 [Coriobacteriia bacterium]|jgi:hypothetical protein
MKRAAVISIAMALVLALAVPALAAAAGGTVTVGATVLPRVKVTPTDDALLVQANTAWTLTIDTPTGAVTRRGAKTQGTLIELPDDTLAYWVVISEP